MAFANSIFQMISGLGETYTNARDRALKQQEEAEMRAAEQERATALLANAAPSRSTNPIPVHGAASPAAPRLPTFAALEGTTPNRDVRGIITGAAQRYGVDPAALTRTAEIESGFNPNAKNPNSSAGGLFQFIDPTAKQYGLTNKFDPVASADAGARLMRDNAALLTKGLGRQPTAGELYFAHQQGAGGALKLLSNPNARAVDLVGADAVRLNGGRPDMLASGFSTKWTSKVDPVQTASSQDATIAGGGSTGTMAGSDDLRSNPPPPPQAGVLPAYVERMLKSGNRYVRAKGIELAEKALAQAPEFGFQTVGEQLYRTDKRAGTVQPVAGVTKPQERWTDITDAAQRQAIGIGPDYQGAVQRHASTGELRFPGRAATTITNNLGGEKTYDQEIGKATLGASRNSATKGDGR